MIMVALENQARIQESALSTGQNNHISSSSSSSSSSPLLSLVQVPAKLAINLSIHTQHTCNNGVDRTGRQGIKKNTAFT